MTDRRGHNNNDLPSLQAGIEVTSQLSYLLDKERNEVLESHLLLSTSKNADILSPGWAITTTSSFAVAHQRQRKPLNSVIYYHRIGIGQCGIISERPGRTYVVKLARPAYHKGLCADFRAHFMVRQAFRQEKKHIMLRTEVILVDYKVKS